MKRSEQMGAMDDARFDGLLRQALSELAAEEAAAKGRKRHPWLLRGARVATAAAAVLAVAFSGVCLASPAIRDQLFALVERQWGSYTEIHVERSAPEETAPATDGQSKVTVDPDDPRLLYVNPDWCLHYYPLGIYDVYSISEVVSFGLFTEVEPDDRFRYHYLTDEQRARELDYDRAKVIFTIPGTKDSFFFAEDGSSAAALRYDERYDDVKREIIGDREVFVIEQEGGSDGDERFYTCFNWWEDDHLLTLAGNLSRWEMERIFRCVERIR